MKIPFLNEIARLAWRAVEPIVTALGVYSRENRLVIQEYLYEEVTIADGYPKAFDAILHNRKLKVSKAEKKFIAYISHWNPSWSKTIWTFRSRKNWAHVSSHDQPIEYTLPLVAGVFDDDLSYYVRVDQESILEWLKTSATCPVLVYLVDSTFSIYVSLNFASRRDALMFKMAFFESFEFKNNDNLKAKMES